MAASCFNTLPGDIFESILTYLNAPTIRIVALADKQTRALARRALFHDITIKVKELEAEIGQWRQVLERNSCLELVRHLRIDGELDPDHVHVRGDQDEDRDFAALEEFLPGLGLTKLTWACSQQFPKSCLTILHGKLPSCRLVLESFRLYSIYDSSLEIYERELMSSPNLDGIICGMEEPPEYDFYKVLWHILSLAPDLRFIDAQHGTSPLVIPNRLFEPATGSAWYRTSTGIGHLRKLYCPDGGDGLNLERIKSWQQATEFSGLRVLSLWRAWEESSASEVFEHLQTSCEFPELVNLALRTPDDPTEGDLRHLKGLLCSLRPLSALALKGDLDSTLMTPILSTHGNSLRKLELTPCIEFQSANNRVVLNRLSCSEHHLRAMLKHCHMLEELAITISRHLGQAEEVACYRILGNTLPHLQHLRLHLDASSLTVFGGEEGGEPEDYQDQDDMPCDPSYDDFDQQPFDIEPFTGVVHLRNGHVRDAFVNSAVDVDLARSIFEVVATAKPQEHSFTLESVEITIAGGGWFGTDNTLSCIEEVCTELQKHWLVQRGIREDCRNEIRTEEIVPRHPEPPLSLEPDQWELLKPIMTRLWPLIESGQAWTEAWRSWPLKA